MNWDMEIKEFKYIRIHMRYPGIEKVPRPVNDIWSDIANIRLYLENAKNHLLYAYCKEEKLDSGLSKHVIHYTYLDQNGIIRTEEENDDYNGFVRIAAKVHLPEKADHTPYGDINALYIRYSPDECVIRLVEQLGLDGRGKNVKNPFAFFKDGTSCDDLIAIASKHQRSHIPFQWLFHRYMFKPCSAAGPLQEDIDAERMIASKAMYANHILYQTDRGELLYLDKEGHFHLHPGLTLLHQVPSGMLDELSGYEKVFFNQEKVFRTDSVAGIFSLQAQVTDTDLYETVCDALRNDRGVSLEEALAKQVEMLPVKRKEKVKSDRRRLPLDPFDQNLWSFQDFITAPRVSVERETDNHNRNSFDFVVVTMSVCIGKERAFEWCKRNAGELKKFAASCIEKNKQYQKYNIPIAFLKLEKATITRDRTLVMQFSIKKNAELACV